MGTDAADSNNPWVFETPLKVVHGQYSSMGNEHILIYAVDQRVPSSRVEKVRQRWYTEGSTFDSSPMLIEDRLSEEEKERFLKPGRRIRIVK